MQGFRNAGISSLAGLAGRWRSVLLLALMILCGQEQVAHATYGFSATAVGLNYERQNHTATVLIDGRVLVAGGMNGLGTYSNTAEIYDPMTRSFTTTANTMKAARQSHTAIRLGDGRVLLMGGNAGNLSAEIFDPSGSGGGTFTSAGSMSTALSNFTATLLQNGTVLIAGGQTGGSSTTQNAAFTYDPGTGVFTATAGTMSSNRRNHTATLLSDGRVLIAGGLTYNGSTSVTTSSAETYNPTARTFAPVTAAMTSPRDTHDAVLLADNRVLITGGNNGGSYLASAEIFDPTGAGGAGTFTATATPMSSAHSPHTATRLLNNKVLIAGGYASFALGITKTGELFTAAAAPGTGSFSSAGTMSRKRINHSGVALNDGSVLLAGGVGDTDSLVTAEIFNPASIDVSLASVTFANTFVGDVSASRTVTITNTGPSIISLSSIALNGSDPTMFTLSANTCGATLAATTGSCSVTVTFAPLTGGNKTASLDITSNDPQKPVLSVPLKGTALNLFPAVTVILGGTGTGSVISNPSGINCDNSGTGNCVSQFNYAAQVTLSAVATGGNSVFTGWTCPTGDCTWLPACSGTGDCVIPSLQFDITASPTFTYVKPAKLDGTAYTFDGIVAAYNSVYAGNGSTIDARDFTFSGETYTFNGKSITIIGGCDLNYAPQSGYDSTINLNGGSFIIGTGQLTLSNILLK